MATLEPDKYLAERVEPLIQELVKAEDAVTAAWLKIERRKLHGPELRVELSPRWLFDVFCGFFVGASLGFLATYSVGAFVTWLTGLQCPQWPSYVFSAVIGLGLADTMYDDSKRVVEVEGERDHLDRELFLAFGRRSIINVQLRERGVDAPNALEAMTAWKKLQAAKNPPKKAPLPSNHSTADRRPTVKQYIDEARKERGREDALIASYRDAKADHEAIVRKRREEISHTYSDNSKIDRYDRDLEALREKLFKLRVMMRHLGVVPDAPKVTPVPKLEPPAPPVPKHVTTTQRLKDEEAAFAEKFASDPELVARARKHYRRRMEEQFAEPDIDYGA